MIVALRVCSSFVEAVRSATQSDQIQLKRPDPDACLPQHSPAWRWCTAMYVSDPYSGNPPNSDDPWVQDAADMRLELSGPTPSPLEQICVQLKRART
jgi:hypothetical protein